MQYTDSFSGRTTMRRATAVTFALTLTAASALSAHDFFLVPGAIPFASGTDVEILAQSSSRFPTSAGAVALARVTRAVMIGADGESNITDMSIRGTSLVLRSRPASDGQRLIAVDLIPRSARQTPVEMLRWIKLEGAADAADRIQRGTALDGLDSVTRTDTKHAKTIIDVGRGGPRAEGGQCATGRIGTGDVPDLRGAVGRRDGEPGPCRRERQ